MDKWRIGQVAGALSGGFGLFFEKKYKEEQQAIERAWQLHLQNIADARAEARDERDFQRRLAISTRDNALAEQRRQADKTDRRAEAETDRKWRSGETDKALTQERNQFFWKLEADRKSDMLAELERIDKQEKTLLDNPMYSIDSTQRGLMMEEFENQREAARATFALSMMDLADMHPDVDAFTQYRANSLEDVKAIFRSTRMDPKLADERAAEVWGWHQGGGGTGGGGGSASARPGAAGGAIPPYLEGKPNPAYIDHVRSREQELDAAIRGGVGTGETAPAPAAPRMDPSPRTPMPEPMMPGDPRNQSNLGRPENLPLYQMELGEGGNARMQWPFRNPFRQATPEERENEGITHALQSPFRPLFVPNE